MTGGYFMHWHYARQPISLHLTHKKVNECAAIRNWISVKIARHLNLEEKSNWNAAALHDVKTCTCDWDSIGRENKKAANEKRREFYNTRNVLPSKNVQGESRDGEQSSQTIIGNERA